MVVGRSWTWYSTKSFLLPLEAISLSRTVIRIRFYPLLIGARGVNFESQGIMASLDNMHVNLKSTIPFYNFTSLLLSRPGRWAYSAMLEVDNLASHAKGRSHYAWCITSSPLILAHQGQS
jgi:hypothetical protein